VYCFACGSALEGPPPQRCVSCGTQTFDDPKPCAGAFVTHEGRLLLVRRAREPWLGCWDVPGGFCEADEHPIHTAERELLEETGLRVRVTGLLGMWMDRYRAPGPGLPPQATLNIYYHAVPLGMPPGAFHSPEVTESGWFEPDRVPERLAFPSHIGPAVTAWREAFVRGRLTSPLPDHPGERPRPNA
jgi:8-oxo-dGTP diphosphatase